MFADGGEEIRSAPRNANGSDDGRNRLDARPRTHPRSFFAAPSCQRNNRWHRWLLRVRTAVGDRRVVRFASGMDRRIRAASRPMWFAFWVFTYIWLGLAGLLRVASGSVTWPIGTPLRDVALGQISILVGLLFLELGVVLRVGGKRHLVPSRVLSPWRTYLVAAFGNSYLPLLPDPSPWRSQRTFLFKRGRQSGSWHLKG